MGVKRKTDDLNGSSSDPQSKSVMQAEDGAFPRGGASVLSSLEIKQAANEATKDVLFGAATEEPKSKKQKRKRSQKQLQQQQQQSKTKPDGKKGIKVESLSFGRLPTGTIVLGQISQVNQMDIAVSLPNNLIGYVPITNVSSQLTAKIEAELEDEQESEEDVSDMSMFKAGQWVKAVVTTNTTGQANQKKRIELSVEPERVNELDEEKLEDLGRGGMIVQGSVKSVEDHGCVIDVGSKTVFGFISKKELNHANLEHVTPGLVLLLTVLSKSSNGRTLTLTASPLAKKVPLVNSLSSSESLTAGMLVEATISEVRSSGIVAKVLEFANATIDQLHSGTMANLSSKFEVGQKVKGRVICTYPDSDPVKVALSFLPNIVGLKTRQDSHPLDRHPIGEFVETTVKLADGLGLYLDINKSTEGGDSSEETTVRSLAYSHISHVSDTRLDDLANDDRYKAGTHHKARITGYSDADNTYIVGLSNTILERKYLRTVDVPVGEVVQGKIDRVIPAKGVIVKITDTIEGIADELHLSDIKLAHPEKKYKPGMKVKAKILSNGKKIRLTLKKSLLNSEEPIITSYDNAEVGMKTPGVIVSLKTKGAIVEFFSGVKAFLPVAEMSEAFIKDPKEHFSLGQSVAVRVLSVDTEEERMTVTCRSSSDDTQALNDLKPGQLVSDAEVIEKPKEGLVVRLASGLRGVIPAGHLSDEGSSKNRTGVKNIKVGEKLDNLVVLEKDTVKRFTTLSAKTSLVADAKAGKLPSDWSEIAENKTLHGYIGNITDAGLFIRFANRLTGLAPKAELGDNFIADLNASFAIDQSVTCRVLSIDDASRRFSLTLKTTSSKNAKSSSNGTTDAAVNPVDDKITLLSEYTAGCVTKAVVVSVKDTQINVKLADNLQGRVDASMAFNDMSDIKDVKEPLKSSFKKGDIIDCKVIGYHDARNHRFLPISHRNATHMLAELSCKTVDLRATEEEYSTIKQENVKVNSEWVAIVNNVTSDFVWVNLSPTIRGRISVLDLCNVDQVSDDIEEFFPVGCAVKCKVVEVGDMLKLSARESDGTAISSAADIKIGQKLPGIITKITPGGITVRLGNQIYAQVGLSDMADEYLEDGGNAAKFSPHELVKCQVVGMNNDRIQVSVRPSLFKSGVKVIDKAIQTSSDLGKGEVVRGFVKNIAKSGLFVQLGHNVTGRVEIRNLSDAFLSDWQQYFSLHQLVKARVLSIDDKGRIDLTLKESAISGEKKIVGVSDLEEGQFLDGIVKRVEDYGVFVRMDGGASGLCHKSQVADIPISDLSKVFTVGDKVKVKVLAVDTEKNRVQLGMKASYFVDEDDDEDMNSEDEDSAEELESEDDAMNPESGSDDEMRIDMESDSEDEDEEESEDDSDRESTAPKKRSAGLSANFDWTTSILDQAAEGGPESDSDSDSEDDSRRKKRKRSKSIVQDKTATLNSKLPQSVQDYERLLVGSPNSSILWMNYMAFQLQLSEIDKARDIGERALKTINFREEQEKMNVWIAMLNLENSFGTEESLDQVFKRSIQYCDPVTMHLKLINILKQSGKQSQAEKLYQACAKKYGSQDMSIYVSYVSYLLENSKLEMAQQIVDRALQALPKHEHRTMVTKHAQLQFEHGHTEEGRTTFESLINIYPKRSDLWSIYLDFEIKHNGEKQPEHVRNLFERLFKHVNLNIKKGRFFFKKWFLFEEKYGDDKSLDYVKAKAQQFVESKQQENEIDNEEDGN